MEIKSLLQMEALKKKAKREELKKDSSEIDIAYILTYTDEEIQERTRERLLEIVSEGFVNCGIDQFGVPGIMSGLYLERVWNYSDEQFEDYLNWAKSLIADKQEV